MLDKDFIREQVDNMMKEKGYDSRARAMLIAFYTTLSDRYDFSEEQLIGAIERYKSTVKKIEFYNVGEDQYKLFRDGILIFDKDTVDSLDETNIERFIQASIKGNSVALIEGYRGNCTEISEMAALSNMYENTPEIYKNITSMIAGGFDIDTGKVISLYDDSFSAMVRAQETGNSAEYDYHNSSRILIGTINDRIKDIMNGKNVKEAYKAIYAACLMNLRIKICDDGLITSKSGMNYIELMESFEKYKAILGIQDSELASVSLDGHNWKTNITKLISTLEEQFKEIKTLDTYTEKKEIPKSRVDRTEIIEGQREENSKTDRSIKEGEIETKVAKLIEQKGYPEEVSEILLAYFSRTAEDFGWDSETLDKKIENLSINVNQFVYVDKDKIGGSAGRFNESERTIELSKSNTFISNLELANTLMHELKHATDCTARGTGEVDEQIIEEPFVSTLEVHGIEICGLDELMTEGSTIMIGGKNPYSDKYATTYRYNSGYAEFCGTATMISSALGMSESEFFKISEKGEAKFRDILETKYPGLDLGTEMTKIQDILTYLNKAAFVRERSTEAFANIYNVLNDVYEARVAIDEQRPDFDPVRARYDEYRLNKNLLVAQRTLGLSRKILVQDTEDYGAIKTKARIRPEEREAFEKIGSQIRGEIKIRDNRELARAGAEVRRYKRYFKPEKTNWRIFLPKAKPQEEKGELIQPKEPNPSFEQKREEFLKGNKQEVNLKQGEVQASKEEGIKAHSEDQIQE